MILVSSLAFPVTRTRGMARLPAAGRVNVKRIPPAPSPTLGLDPVPVRFDEPHGGRETEPDPAGEARPP